MIRAWTIVRLWWLESGVRIVQSRFTDQRDGVSIDCRLGFQTRAMTGRRTPREAFQRFEELSSLTRADNAMKRKALRRSLQLRICSKTQFVARYIQTKFQGYLNAPLSKTQAYQVTMWCVIFCLLPSFCVSSRRCPASRKKIFYSFTFAEKML